VDFKNTDTCFKNNWLCLNVDVAASEWLLIFILKIKRIYGYGYLYELQQQGTSG
jgi:hypothetical protein